MSQFTGRVKPGMRGGRKSPMSSMGRPSEPGKSTRPRTTRTPGGGNLGTLISGKTQGKRK